MSNIEKLTILKMLTLSLPGGPVGGPFILALLQNVSMRERYEREAATWVRGRIAEYQTTPFWCNKRPESVAAFILTHILSRAKPDLWGQFKTFDGFCKYWVAEAKRDAREVAAVLERVVDSPPG